MGLARIMKRKSMKAQLVELTKQHNLMMRAFMGTLEQEKKAAYARGLEDGKTVSLENPLLDEGGVTLPPGREALPFTDGESA